MALRVASRVLCGLGLTTMDKIPRLLRNEVVQVPCGEEHVLLGRTSLPDFSPMRHVP